MLFVVLYYNFIICAGEPMLWRDADDDDDDDEEEDGDVNDDDHHHHDDALIDDISDIGIPNIYKVMRALKKDDHGAYNCLASIVQDTAFVRRVTG